jgi:hypothetical protein
MGRAIRIIAVILLSFSFQLMNDGFRTLIWLLQLVS